MILVLIELIILAHTVAVLLFIFSWLYVTYVLLSLYYKQVDEVTDLLASFTSLSIQMQNMGDR